MTIKEYLGQLHNKDRVLQAKHEHINTLKDRAEKATSTMTAVRMGGTDVHSKLEDAVCKMVDLQTEIADDIQDYYALRREMTAMIDSLDNEVYREILKLRHLDFKQWDDIAVIMMYDRRWIFRLYNQALKAIESHYKMVI